jgi:hypothetical protein
MPFTRERPPSWREDGPGNTSCLGGIDGSETTRIERPAQAEILRNLRARRQLRRQRLVQHLHRLGPAPLGHFLREIEAGAAIPEHLERYSRIDPEFIRAYGGDRFAPSLWPIDGGRR